MHSFAPVPSAAEDILGTAVYGAPFASVVAHESFYGVQFHPEKSSAAGLRLLANFARICAHRSVSRPAYRWIVNLYPAIDMLGGKAVRLVKGDFDAKKVYDEDPLSAASALGAGGSAPACMSSTSTGRATGAPANSSTCGASRASSACRFSSAAVCARRQSIEEVSMRVPSA